MATKVILNNESIVPFFGDRISFIRGLDPLGLQNTSDATFSLLLPGLNNVTGRIRYYSFYCWLFDVYSKVIGSTNPDDQKQFIRRAEYIIALASQYITEDASSIPGSNYARQEIVYKGEVHHSLQAGTFKEDGSTRETYWNYGTGAFGQYYLGSLRDIGIITERDNHVGVYVRTNKREDKSVSGEELAESFDANISPQNKALFLKCISTGSISDIQLKQLLPEFDLTTITKDSDEQNLLIGLLLQKDFPLRIEETPKTLRNQTIKHLLSFIKINEGDFSDRIFIYNCFDKKGKEQTSDDECLIGWYYYQFNEFWHFANTSIFNGTLAYLEKISDPNWYPLSHLVKEVTNQVTAKLIELNLATDEETTLIEVLTNLSRNTNIYNYFELTTKSEINDKVANSFLLLFTLFLENKDKLIDLKTYAESNQIAKDGEGTGYFITQFESKKSIAIQKFVYDYVFLNIIYRHQYVAFRKIGGGSQSTQKFIIEDNYIRYLGNFEAGYTGPRIGRLIAFLKDLDIISNENKLTSKGELLTSELQSNND
jgi:hypothetical protein